MRADAIFENIIRKQNNGFHRHDLHFFVAVEFDRCQSTLSVWWAVPRFERTDDSVVGPHKPIPRQSTSLYGGRAEALAWFWHSASYQHSPIIVL
jgi:hypothetical protein